MTAWADFFPYIQPLVPSCPNPSVEHAVRAACIEFCDQTHFLTDTMDQITFVAGENTYEVDVPTGYVLSQPVVLFANGLQLVRKAPHELEQLFGRLDWQEVTGTTPCYFTMFNTYEIVLAPTPDATGVVTGRIAYTPSRTATEVDDQVFESYAEVIADGALAQIYMHPDQPYTSATLALAHRSKFDAGIANAKATVRGGMSAATPMQVRFRRHW